MQVENKDSETKDESKKEQDSKKEQEPKKDMKVEEKEKQEQPKQESKQEPKVEDAHISRLMEYETKNKKLQQELVDYKVKVKTFEKEARKSVILSTLRDEFPGLPKDEILGAALVAQEAGKVDLFSEKTEDQIKALKEILKTKKVEKPAISFGGSTAPPGKESNSAKRKFLI